MIGATAAIAPGTAAAAPAAAAPAHITIRGLSKRFQGAVIYDGFDLDIARGEFLSIFGPNGCGKSTLINIVAGLVPADAGTIRFGGKELRDTKIGYVFQNYREALFPWLRSFDNIEYPLKLAKLPGPERRAKVERLVVHLGVKIDLDRYPYELSGGQQQLVSIMRALVVEPEVLFLDEPFSALDYEMTLFMREQLQRIFMETRTTTVLVSHDLEEAVYLADRVLLLSRRPARIADCPARDDAAAARRRDALRGRVRGDQGPLPGGVPARGAQGMKRDALLPVVGVAGLIAVWYLAVWARVVDPVLLPSPDQAFAALVKGMAGGKLGIDFWRTVERTAYAIAIAAVIAIPLGVLLGANERAYRAVEFVIDFFRSTPASAMFPLFLVIFGVGDKTKILVASFGAALVILFNVAYGVMNARKTRLLAARVMGASKLRVLTDVMLLESLPQTFVGLRNGVSLALVIVVVAEMFIGSTDGLGQRVFEAQQLFAMPDMYAAIFAAGALGYGLNLLFMLVEKRFVHWAGK